jgi:photosystem II stability/assembly factor-like uncharacterized protein
MKKFSLIILLTIILFCVTQCKKDENPGQNNNWETIYQNNDLDLYSVNFLDKDNGFVMADSSGIHGISDWKLVLATKDGGNTWNPMTCTTNDTVNQFPLYDIGYIYPISQNVLLTTGYQVHKSNDAGKTWINLSPQMSGSRIYDLYVIDSLTWLVAKGNYILRTNNAGQTWQTVYDRWPLMDHFSFPSSSTGYAYGGYFNCGVTGIGPCVNYGNVSKTIDGGQSWTNVKSEPWNSGGVSIPYITNLQFITDDIGYFSTFSEDKLYKTVDGGNNWTALQNNNGLNVYTLLYFIDEDKGYYCDGKTIYATNDGGMTWKVDYYNNTSNSDILTWTFLKSGEGYALTRDHRIIKRNNLY